MHGKNWPNLPTRGFSAITPWHVMRITWNLKHYRGIVRRIKAPQKFEIGQGSRPAGATLYHKVDIFDILGPHSHLSAPIDGKFCTAKRTQVPVGPAKFDLNRCNHSPMLGEKPDFWPVSKNNTGSLPLPGILPVTKLETKASSHKGQCIPAGCRVTLPRRVLITMSIITMRSKPFPAKSASDCLRFAKPRPQFSNLVAPSTDGSAKCLVRYKANLVM